MLEDRGIRLAPRSSEVLSRHFGWALSRHCGRASAEAAQAEKYRDAAYFCRETRQASNKTAVPYLPDQKNKVRCCFPLLADIAQPIVEYGLSKRLRALQALIFPVPSLLIHNTVPLVN